MHGKWICSARPVTVVVILRFVHVHDYNIVATDTPSLLVVGSVVVVRVQLKIHSFEQSPALTLASMTRAYLSWIHDSKRVYRSLDRLHQTYCTRTEFLDQEFLLPDPDSVFACT